MSEAAQQTQETSVTPPTTPPTPPTPPASTPPSTEQKTETKTEAKPSLLNEGEKTEVQGAPEKYEAYTLPEGWELSEEIATEANTLFKELNLPQAAAQKLVDFYIKTSESSQDSVANAWIEMQNTWRSEISTDKTLGNGTDGLKPEVKATIGKFIDSMGDAQLVADFREAMNLTGAGNNPAFVRAMYSVAKKFTEGGHVSGDKPSAAGQSKPGAVAGTGPSALYPNLPAS